ncbi:MAG: SET domain-containing protein-lysine N-methyltransferase [Gemmatimonadales bacterium]
MVAIRPVKVGEKVLTLDGEELGRPSRHSIQLDARTHIEVTGDLSLERLMRDHPWHFTNHSCDPNTRLVGRDLVAVRPVRAGDEITYNYNTSEWELAEPFECRCGSPDCERTIRGFKYLGAAERERIKPLLTPHLLKRELPRP